MFWAPATVVGDGDEPAGVDGGRVATGVPVTVVDDVGDADCDEGGAEGEDDGGVVPGDGAVWATGADGLAEPEEGLGLA